MVATRKTIFQSTIRSWGKSLGLRITGPLRDLTQLQKGTKVRIEITEGGMFIMPLNRIRAAQVVLPYAEEDLVRGLTPTKAHADELPTSLPSEKEATDRG